MGTIYFGDTITLWYNLKYLTQWQNVMYHKKKKVLKAYETCIVLNVDQANKWQWRYNRDISVHNIEETWNRSKKICRVSLVEMYSVQCVFKWRYFVTSYYLWRRSWRLEMVYFFVFILCVCSFFSFSKVLYEYLYVLVIIWFSAN